MKSNFTPGPWTVELIGDNAAEIQPQNYLLRFGGDADIYERTYVADARLIAAAPELLEA